MFTDVLVSLPFCNIIMTGEATMALNLIFSSEHMSQLSITGSKVKWPLCFAYSYDQPITQHYKWRKLGEAILQSIHSPLKMQMIPIYKHRETIKLP